MWINNQILLIIVIFPTFCTTIASENYFKNISNTDYQIEKINNSFFLINGSDKCALKKCKPAQDFENGKLYGEFLVLEFRKTDQKYVMIYSIKTDWSICFRVDACYFSDTKVLFFNIEKSTIEYAVIEGKNANYPVNYYPFYTNDNVENSRVKLQVNQTLKILELFLIGQVETFNLSIFDQIPIIVNCSGNILLIWLLISGNVLFLLLFIAGIIVFGYRKWKTRSTRTNQLLHDQETLVYHPPPYSCTKLDDGIFRGIPTEISVESC